MWGKPGELFFRWLATRTGTEVHMVLSGRARAQTPHVHLTADLLLLVLTTRLNWLSGMASVEGGRGVKTPDFRNSESGRAGVWGGREGWVEGLMLGKGG